MPVLNMAKQGSTPEYPAPASRRSPPPAPKLRYQPNDPMDLKAQQQFMLPDCCLFSDEGINENGGMSNQMAAAMEEWSLNLNSKVNRHLSSQGDDSPRMQLSRASPAPRSILELIRADMMPHGPAAPQAPKLMPKASPTLSPDFAQLELPPSVLDNVPLRSRCSSYNSEPTDVADFDLEECIFEIVEEEVSTAEGSAVGSAGDFGDIGPGFWLDAGEMGVFCDMDSSDPPTPRSAQYPHEKLCRSRSSSSDTIKFRARSCSSSLSTCAGSPPFGASPLLLQTVRKMSADFEL